MSEDRRTKAVLLEQLQHAQDGAAAARNRQNQREQAFRDERATRDAEAVAIENCVRALRVLEPAQSSTRTSGTTYNISGGGSTTYSDSPNLERALSYLRRRFGLPDPTTEIEQLREHLGQAELRAENAERAIAGARMTLGQPL